MEHTEPILDQDKRSEVMRGLAPYMERVRAIHAENTPDQIIEIEMRYRGWLRGHNVPEERLRSMTLIDLLIEADHRDRSEDIVGN